MAKFIRQIPAFSEARVEFTRRGTVYTVEGVDGSIHFFRSPGEANAAFPGAFDMPDDEQD